MKYLLLPALLLWSAFAADKPTAPQLLDLSGKPNQPAFAEALTAAFGAKPIQEGTAIIGEGPNFLWAFESPAAPELYVDDQRVGALSRIGTSNTWFYKGQLKTGTSHVFYYMVDGHKLGGKNDIPAYGPESYAKPGVPQGKLSEKMVHTSKIYEGMQSNWWTYVPAQYDPAKPACVHVNQDGLQNNANVVFDNLIARGELPVVMRADAEDDIRAAVRFADEHGLKLIVAGGLEAWRCADLLRDKGIPVLLNVERLPARESDRYDAAYTNAAALQKAGVRFAIVSDDAAHVRDLPYEAAMARAFGLPAEAALRAITLSPAEIFGVAFRMGSLEVGKDANVIVTTGDVMDHRTAVVDVIIDGIPQSLESRHTRLYQEFKDRP